MRRRILLLAAGLLATSASAGPLRAQERDFPYTLGGRDLPLAAVAVASLGFYAARYHALAPLTPEEIALLDPASVNAFDRGATENWSEGWQGVSDWTRNGLIAAAGLAGFVPLVADGSWGEVATLGVVFAETAALTVGITGVAKVLTARKRPYLYNHALTPDARADVASDSGDGFHSFFSGHTSVAFATATLLATTYSDLYGSSTTSKWIWASSLGAATLVGVARVQGGMHFPTDVLAGAALGAAIGHWVPRLHRSPEAALRVVATPGYVGLRWSF